MILKTEFLKIKNYWIQNIKVKADGEKKSELI